MSNIILFHGDLDGLYSAILFYNTNKDDLNIDEIRSIEYGQDHSTLYDQFDEFFVFDFAENPGGDKTILWVDHHIKQGEDLAELSVVKETASCVQLMIESKIASRDILSEKDVEYINMVDSAKFPWSDDFTYEDFLFPDPDKDRLSKFIVLNQLLRKNRKFGLAEKLFLTNDLDVERLLSRIENDKHEKTTKYSYMLECRQKLMEKMIANTDEYIKYFDKVPILFTKKFSQKDWKGYDLNILGYLANKSPYMIVIFDFGRDVNIQITRNIFCEGEHDSVYQIIKDEIDDPRGHEGIINMTFENSIEAIKKIDKITKLLSEHIK